METLVFAFVAFLAACSAARFSLAALMADSRAAVLASGLWFLRSLMTSREAPTIALWDLTVLRERFLATSYMVKCSLVILIFRIPMIFSVPSRYGLSRRISYLRDTLLVLSSEENGPCNSARVLALQEQRFGFTVLETEDLGVSTDVELALYNSQK